MKITKIDTTPVTRVTKMGNLHTDGVNPSTKPEKQTMSLAEIHARRLNGNNNG